MARPQIRPHFQLDVPLTADQVSARLQERLESPGSGFDGAVLKRHCQVTVAPSRRRFFSPWLSFEIEELPDGARLSGQFTPHPNVWTLWAALYAVVLILATGGLLVGASQWLIDQPAWALWLVPGGLAVAAALYVGALAGQRLCADEMDEIRALVHGALDSPAVDPASPRAAAPPELATT